MAIKEREIRTLLVHHNFTEKNENIKLLQELLNL